MVNGNQLPETAGNILNTKKPSISWDIQKNYEKNMKTLANRTRKLLAYLYYSKKAAQAQA